ncbi:hypothetical protein LCGC14_0342340 [marine sediment metagenome]|uniref:Uncharacterized protein n=1 Tax=marine sediment metagenome TaxID=412755 RepID=A0A0F9TW85_9ZZZZ
MGYTHYWYRKPELDDAKFAEFADATEKIIAESERLGIKIDNDSDKNTVFFNGSDVQPVGEWTTNEPLGIAWPSEYAGLVDVLADPCTSKVDGDWFAGKTLAKRTAPINNGTGLGEGDHETMYIEKIVPPDDLSREFAKVRNQELLFAFCKTAYKPYDLTVTACLIAFKHFFGEDVVISTDGDDKDWLDGKLVCQKLFGYGLEYSINSDGKLSHCQDPETK